jgi:hypothetical protein
MKLIKRFFRILYIKWVLKSKEKEVCQSTPTNIDSHKPINYKEKGK